MGHRFLLLTHIVGGIYSLNLYRYELLLSYSSLYLLRGSMSINESSRTDPRLESSIWGVRQVLHIYGIALPSATSAICCRRISASNSVRDREDIPEAILTSCASLSLKSQEPAVNDAI